ncbi:uncharacterized protein LOC110457380 [Mizuhopecten yessoensis]|uniref:uncharacterized protein LOC110457380 n=1 Tax=Mizuhopecten yessoensis TaxID=6573 RepID=UPI000B45D27C|nr:uncharacterized protein LOC110457380 [Mizuhopecten yessoensis]
MVCPPGFYIHIYEAYYGSESVPCSISDPVSTLRTACHGATETCNVIFSDTFFGGDPCSSDPSAVKSGYIIYNCARSKTLDEARGPWRLVFKVPSGTSPPAGYNDIMALYTSSDAYNEGNTAAMVDFSAGGSIYKSSILNQWGSNLTATAAKVSFFKSGQEQAYVVFDASGKGKDDWFDQTRIIDSNWIDIETGNTTCEINSGDNYKRVFQIKSDYTGCSNETGWFMMKDYGATEGCSGWDTVATTMPYMYYSTTGLRTQWSSADKELADSFAIFLMDWHMVFKVVAEVQTDGSLETIWTGSSSINDGLDSAISVTNSPNSNYKSSVVETWSEDFTFMDMVKYAYFTGGVEKAWIVFDGRGTSKTSWFADSKILFSSYSDIQTAGKGTVSITGDGIRSFATILSYSDCASLTGWMMMSDYSSSTTCTFDNAGTKPYFIYSSTETYGLPQSASSWDSTNFPKADVLGIFINGWFPVLKVSKEFGVSPASGIYDLWNNTYTVNEYNDSLNAFSFAANTMPYKSSIVDFWTNYYIKAARVSFIVSGTEQAYVVFDAHGTTKMSWFSCDRILYSSWTDLNNEGTQDYCSIQGNEPYKQHFLMESSYGTSCATNSGWFSVVERTSGGCSWEQKDSTFPHVVYSDTTTAELNTGSIYILMNGEYY